MSYKIISKFIKDISFEIPNAQAFMMLDREISNYTLNFDIKSNPFKNNIIEVDTVLKIVPNKELKNKMFAEINLAALVSIEKDIKDKKELERIVLINDPTDVYPVLYDTFIYLFRQAGIKEISIIKEVNFEKLYKEKKINEEIIEGDFEDTKQNDNKKDY